MRIRRLGVVLATVPLVLVGACSATKAEPQVASLQKPAASSLSNPDGGTESGADAWKAYDECLTEHGGSHAAMPDASGRLELSDADLEASAACQPLAPTEDPKQKASAAQDALAAALELAACMRSEGIAWPDPTVGDSTAAAPPGGSSMASTDGTSFQLPADVDLNSPKVRAAFETCQPGVGEITTFEQSAPSS